MNTIQLDLILKNMEINDNSKLLIISGQCDEALQNAFNKDNIYFLSLYESSKNSIQADICNCEHLPSGSFDCIISEAVFEHLKNPFFAAKNIMRLLRENGLTTHIAPFSFYYHAAPNDYFRFTPEAFKELFYELHVITSEFYTPNRRAMLYNTNINFDTSPKKETVQSDALGGWAENWYVFYVGRKKFGVNLALKQLIVDLVYYCYDQGFENYLQRAYELIDKFVIIDNFIKYTEDNFYNFEFSYFIKIYRESFEGGITPSYNRYVLSTLINSKLDSSLLGIPVRSNPPPQKNNI